jgi:8-oxo-dGTP pyrophosphatase MutT (NUDIX family)
VTGFRRIGERVVHDGLIWRVVEATFVDPSGRPFTRDIVRSVGAVGVVPVVFDPEGAASVILVRQYRPSLEVEMLEVPAGMRDVPGEPPEDTARRELREEAGVDAENLALLTVIHPSAGVTDATTHIYVATGLRPAARDAQGPEEEAMTVLQLPMTEAVALVLDGTITDAKTVVGLLLAERFVGRT